MSVPLFAVLLPLTFRSLSPLLMVLLLLGSGVMLQSDPAAATATRDRTKIAQRRSQTYKFGKPPANGSPVTAGSGGSRDDCTQADRPILQAITPIAPDKTVGGLTYSDQPAFWFYTNLSHQCYRFEFVLQNDRGRVLMRQPLTSVPFAVPFSLHLPPHIRLQSQKSYRWTFQATRLTQSNNPPALVAGWVQRIKPTAVIQDNLSTIDRAKATATAGIWHETISLVQDLLQQDPNHTEARQLWNTIVQDAGLPEFLQTPTIVNH